MKPVRRSLAVLLLLVLACSTAWAQETLTEAELITEKAKALRNIASSIEDIENQLLKSRELLKVAKNKSESDHLQETIDTLKEQRDELNAEFTLTATGIDEKALFSEEVAESVKVQEEVQEIIAPLMGELKRATERPRRIEKLRTEIYLYETHLSQVVKALDSLKLLKERSNDSKIQSRLQALSEFWILQRKRLETQLDSAKRQLQETQSQSRSLSETSTLVFQSFFKSRGRNLILSVLGFLGTFLLLLALHSFLVGVSPLHKSEERIFLRNLLDIMYRVGAFLLSVAVLVGILYTSGDWLLLGLALLVLLALAWAARNTLPGWVEQIRLLLNLGAVRRGERVRYNGIDWKVESIGFSSYLCNPLLTGGVIRLPLADLLGMRSRPYDSSEPWFPCKEGDAILLNGDWRVVSLQTPEFVTFDWFGMPEKRTTGSVVGGTVYNLSEADYWVGITVGLSHRERGRLLEEVVPKLDERVKKEIGGHPEVGKHLLDTWVDIADITSRSLDVMIWVQMAKESAHRYGVLTNELFRLALAEANENDWDISPIERKESVDSEKPWPKPKVS